MPASCDTAGISAWSNAWLAARLPFIFQLPATSFRRMPEVARKINEFYRRWPEGSTRISGKRLDY
jgi:hypothetical protein